MDDNIATFLAFTATEDPAVAKQYMDISGGNLEYAVQLFMESGSQQTPLPGASNDEEMAQRLQSQAFKDNEIREADANIHRHETLLDSFPTYDSGLENANAIFGTGRIGIFNQRFLEEDAYSDQIDGEEFGDSDADHGIIELNSDDDGEVIELDLEEERSGRLNRRTRAQRDRSNELSSTQRRLAELFKPPFELILRTSLDGARQQGKVERKWILVNIQDQSEFQCQVLNRDFWTDSSVRDIVRSEFIFLQYQNDSPHGQNYQNFYSVTAYPHISILDPMTGERVYTWTDGVVPSVDEWVSDVELFLEKFSLLPGSSNPVVKHESRIDPDAMTEEEQIAYALQQSMGNNTEASPSSSAGSSSQLENLSPDEVLQDPFSGILPRPHTEPVSGPLTRVQVRFPNGKRLIHKFHPEFDTVSTIYSWLKFVLSEAEESAYGIGNEGFTISCTGKTKLLECVNQTIKEAGLSNASILLERI